MQNDWKAFQSPSFQRASENNRSLPKKKPEGGWRCLRVPAQQKQTGCRAAGCNWLSNKRNAQALCCTLSGCRRSVTQMLPDENIRHGSSKTEILMSSFLVQELLMFHIVQYITIRLFYTLFHILRIFSNWFYTCFRDSHSPVRVKGKKQRPKKKRGKGTWLLPVRSNAVQRRDDVWVWCVCVSSWSAWWAGPLKPITLSGQGSRKGWKQSLES